MAESSSESPATNPGQITPAANIDLPRSFDAAAQPQHRVVLLGASNLTRALARVVATARCYCGGPIEILTALGHGRAYCNPSLLLGRGLSSIHDCRLWETLHGLPQAPTRALLTDVGNDLLLGSRAESIASSVRGCIERLQAKDARVTVTSLPVGNLDTLSPRRFLFFRRLFFPRCQLTLAEVAAETVELNARLQQMASELELTIVDLRPEWYGLDPIHIKTRYWSLAWGDILAPFYVGDQQRPTVPRPPLAHWPYLRLRRPDEYTLFGIRRGKKQPHGRFADGTTISFF